MPRREDNNTPLFSERSGSRSPDLPLPRSVTPPPLTQAQHIARTMTADIFQSVLPKQIAQGQTQETEQAKRKTQYLVDCSLFEKKYHTACKNRTSAEILQLAMKQYNLFRYQILTNRFTHYPSEIFQEALALLDSLQPTRSSAIPFFPPAADDYPLRRSVSQEHFDPMREIYGYET